MKRVFIFIAFALPVFLTCSQWKVSSLKPKEMAFFKNGDVPGSVKINSDEYALDNLSFGLGVFNNSYCIADNIMKRIQVMDSDGNVKIIIGNTKEIDTKKVRAVSFNFSAIGSFTMDGKDNLYVQNRFPQPESVSRLTVNPEAEDQGNEIDFSPSYVLVFNSDGELQYTLGQRGGPDIPFYYIEQLDIDVKGRLFVITRSFTSWSIYRFVNKKPDFSIDFGKNDFEDKDGKEVYKGKIENVKIFRNGDYFLVSVAYYQGLRLKYRKIYEYSMQNKNISRTVINIPDPRNVLFNIFDDKLIYFWNMNNREVKFMICNLEGSIVNNIHLSFNYSKNHYSKLIADTSGNIYSYHATNGGIKVIKWE